MIEIVYYEKEHRVTVSGHAYSGPHGRDVVCSAISVLSFTLAKAVDELDKRCDLDELTVELGVGEADISCNGEYPRCIKLIYDTICLGYEAIAESFPDKVSFARA